MRKLGIVVTGLVLATFLTTAGPAGRVSAGEVPQCHGYDATIWSDEDGATLTGTSKRDVIVGTEGDDIIKGNGGNDVICGGWGDDHINGNSGNDDIEGGFGSDYVAGDAGNDELRGFIAPQLIFDVEAEGFPGAPDEVYGGSGNDLLIDFWGWNHLDGGSGNDLVFGQGDLYGGSNNDTVSSNFGHFFDVVYGNRAQANGTCGADVESAGCNAGSYHDGGSGSDLLVGTWADDTLKGQSGNDELWGEGGDDEYNGGSGNDFCAEPGTSCEIVD